MDGLREWTDSRIQDLLGKDADIDMVRSNHHFEYHTCACSFEPWPQVREQLNLVFGDFMEPAAEASASPASSPGGFHTGKLMAPSLR